MSRLLFLVIVAIMAAPTASCREITVPNLNGPSAEQLTVAPTNSIVNMATTGLLAQLRQGVVHDTRHLGILGKESYFLNPSEARYVTVWMLGAMQPGTFQEDFGWIPSYQTLRQSALILAAAEKVPFSAGERQGLLGFVKTVMALELHRQARIRDAAGMVVEWSAADVPPLSPIVSRDSAMKRIAELLDEAKVHLETPDASFAFPLHAGFNGFMKPLDFVRFNRAVKARVEVERRAWSSALTALDASFIDASTGAVASLARGVYHVYGATPDSPNGMIGPSIFVHPTIISGAQLKPGGAPDNRVTAKTVPGPPRIVAGVVGSHRFRIYPSNTTSVPIIRNEELILLRAEARYHSGDVAGALSDINLIRVSAGGLAPLGGFATSKDFVDELLYNRTYSLLYEGGHRWVDARRYDRLSLLPKVNAGEKTFPYIMLPIAECASRNPRPQPGCSEVPAI